MNAYQAFDTLVLAEAKINDSSKRQAFGFDLCVLIGIEAAQSPDFAKLMWEIAQGKGSVNTEFLVANRLRMEKIELSPTGEALFQKIMGGF